MSLEFGDSMAFPPVHALPGLSPIPSATLRPFVLIYTGAYAGSVSRFSGVLAAQYHVEDN